MQKENNSQISEIKEDNSENKSIRSKYFVFLRNYLVLSTISLVVVSTLLFLINVTPPIVNLVKTYDLYLTEKMNGLKEIPEMNMRIDQLNQKIMLLNEKTIDNRLALIEESISKGKIDTSKIKTLNDLCYDFSKMKSYMFSDPSQLVELKQLQSDYHSLKNNIDELVSKDDFIDKIDNLWNVYYITLSFAGILFTIFFGSWWFTNKRTYKSTEPVNRAKEK